MTLPRRFLTLFDSHFGIDQPNWAQLVDLFNERYDSVTKKEEVSEELSTLRMKDFRKEDGNEKSTRKTA